MCFVQRQRPTEAESMYGMQKDPVLFRGLPKGGLESAQAEVQCIGGPAEDSEVSNVAD